MHATLALAGLFTSAFLSAQSLTTLPANMATTEGSYLMNVPLVRAPARVQCAYSQKATAWTGPRVIRKLSVRCDRNSRQIAATTMDMQIWLSSRGADLFTSSSDFDANHGVDRVLFMKRRSFKLAPFGSSNEVHPFRLEMKGDTPFIAVLGQLLVDWATYNPPYFNSGYWVDAEAATRIGTKGTITPVGSSCNPSDFTLHGHGANIDEILTLVAYTKNPGDVLYHWLSTRRENLSIGSGCTLYALFDARSSVIFPEPVTTVGVHGSAILTWGRVPTLFHRHTLTAQAMAFGPNETQRWSHGLVFQFGDYGPPYLTSSRYGGSEQSKSFDPDKDKADFGVTGAAIVFKVD